jgi:putative ABC transport system substrate-binding protein
MNARTAAWALAVLGVTLAPGPAEPQAEDKPPRGLTRQASEPRDIGVLFAGTATFLGQGGLMAGKPPAFSRGLRELGHVDGQDIAIRFLSAESQADRLPDLAKDLVDDGVSVIVAIGDQAVEAARRATSTIPIVMAPSRDPVRSGFVGDLARPAGNITGLATARPNSPATRLRTLKEIVPTMSRVAVIWMSTGFSRAPGRRTCPWSSRGSTSWSSI